MGFNPHFPADSRSLPLGFGIKSIALHRAAGNMDDMPKDSGAPMQTLLPLGNPPDSSPFYTVKHIKFSVLELD
jgi:hypothetical protein